MDTEIVHILKQGEINGNTFFLPQITLERATYEAVNKALVAMGAKWNRKAKGHVFDYDITGELENVIKTGIVTDWKKSTDFFYTPREVVGYMLAAISNYRYGWDNPTMLEPSAGQGHILDVLKEEFPNVKQYCVEQNPMHCERLREKGYKPIQSDFLEVSPFPVDFVVMNPPFTYEMEHIRHAYDFVKEGGELCSVTSAMILKKSTKKGKEFKEWFDSVGGSVCKLPQNSFKESGTTVSTQIIHIGKY